MLVVGFSDILGRLCVENCIQIARCEATKLQELLAAGASLQAHAFRDS